MKDDMWRSPSTNGWDVKEHLSLFNELRPPYTLEMSYVPADFSRSGQLCIGTSRLLPSGERRIGHVVFQHLLLLFSLERYCHESCLTAIDNTCPTERSVHLYGKVGSNSYLLWLTAIQSVWAPLDSISISFILNTQYSMKCVSIIL